MLWVKQASGSLRTEVRGKRVAQRLASSPEISVWLRHPGELQACMRDEINLDADWRPCACL